jgi:pyruvate, water dikinase
LTTTDETSARRFLSPFEVPTPEGAEGWQEMYPPYLLFSEENREWEENSFWFLDSLHRPEIEYPFDTIVHEAWSIALGAFVSRVFQIPSSSGFVHRVLNGRLYLSAAEITDPKEIEGRVPTFMRRAGFYYERWGDLFVQWKEKMEAVIDELRALEVPELPDVEPEEVVTEHTGISSGLRLLRAYSDAVQNVMRAYQYHFEMHLCGYGAWLNLFQFCQQAFPGIPEQTVANMAAGADILMFRPDDELKRLAQRAHDLGLAGRIQSGGADEVLGQLREDGAGREWVDAFEAAKYPWFYFSKGTGLYHHERSWVDDLSVPWGMLQSYVDRLGRGEGLDRPRQGILERREQLTNEYRALLSNDADRATFDQTVELARTVAAYVEDHNFYIENWHHTVFWNKMREFGRRCVDAGTLEDVEDLFYLNRWEVGQALHDTVLAWAMSRPGRSQHWRSLVARRKKTLEALRRWSPEPALGPAPGEIQEPFTLMAWGITTERVQQWLASGEDDGKEIRGVAGSAGVVEGVARVILSVDELATVEEGEILVCPITAPTWGPVFGKIRAAVSDMGGIMSHAAIVSREYGLPAVVGTARGTKLLQTGMRVRVDGNEGVVTVLS